MSSLCTSKLDTFNGTIINRKGCLNTTNACSKVEVMLQRGIRTLDQGIRGVCYMLLQRVYGCGYHILQHIGTKIYVIGSRMRAIHQVLNGLGLQVFKV